MALMAMHPQCPERCKRAAVALHDPCAEARRGAAQKPPRSDGPPRLGSTRAAPVQCRVDERQTNPRSPDQVGSAHGYLHRGVLVVLHGLPRTPLPLLRIPIYKAATRNLLRPR